MKFTPVLLVAALCGCGYTSARAAEPAGPAATTQPDPASSQEASPSALQTLAGDIGAYYTAPLHWRLAEWGWFAGTVALVAGSHQFDDNTRTHFTRDLPNSGLGTQKSHDVQDAAPAAAALVATWVGAAWLDSPDGRGETWMMVESAGLSTVTAVALKYAAGRQDPSETTDPNKWRAGGSSFPSLHTTAAFAIGTVLAESGNDDYRWVRRVLGYGIGGYTAYARLKHNAHWLSDTVAGAALGASTASFVMHRRESGGPERTSGLSVVPVPRGVMLTYAVDLSKY
jgi:membrane-associated phospholipid phosphatase